jgi:hypothetical protein
MRGGVLVALMAVGCPKASTVDTAIAAATAPIDAAWSARDRDGLEPVFAALDAVPATLAGRPEVLWRRARAQVSQGMIDDRPVDARRDYALARATAIACLSLDGAVDAALQQGHVAAAVEAVPATSADCAAWAGYAWARWLTTFSGRAAAVDVATVDALLDRGAVDADDARRTITRWGHVLVGLATGETPDLGDALAGDVDGAWARYEDARRLAPKVATTLPTRPPSTPEDRAAARRLLRSAARPTP